jgi:stage II sporulation protein D
VLTYNNQYVKLLLVVVSVILSTCTPHDFIQPNPPLSSVPTNDSAKVHPDTINHEVPEIDFADAFDTTKPIHSESYPHSSPLHPNFPNVSVTSMRFASYNVPTNKVRIAIARNCNRMVIYSVGNAALNSKKLKKPLALRGRILFEIGSGGEKVKISSRNINAEILMPCTLRSENEYNFLDIGDTTYRGSIVLVSAKSNRFVLVNVLPMEEYLRGVVPLELGRRSPEEMEALKAQAVAARTYAYKRILERTAEPFDMVSTTADQVYGGASVEYRESDAAIKATRDLLLVYGESVVHAYYHSTCGGVTAAISDVWDKPSQPYLHAISDTDTSGKAYCALSTYFTWDESWEWKQFSKITHDFLLKIVPKNNFTGPVSDFTIDERFICGRIKKARIIGNGWEQACGGDQIRYILRRGVSGYPILRSSNFSIEKLDNSVIRLSGKGHGHGVGMCQMGAVGRALAGQNFVSILASYYTGASIVSARCAKTEKE